MTSSTYDYDELLLRYKFDNTTYNQYLLAYLY